MATPVIVDLGVANAIRARRIVALLRRTSATVTPIGWGVLSVAAVAYALGLAFGWREALVVAAGAVAIAVVSALWLFGSLGLSLRRELPRDHVTVGDRLVVALAVQNPTRWPTGRRIARDQVGAQSIALRVPRLAARAEHTDRYVVPTEARGRFSLGPLGVVRGDPFGLFRRYRDVGGIDTVWVQPRVHVLATPARSWTADIDGPTFDSSPRGGTVFHALRDYQPGDDVRHIHWRSTARSGRIVVRNFVDTRRSAPMLLFDNRADVYERPEVYEFAVEVGASIALSAVRAGHPLVAFAEPGGELGGLHASRSADRLLEHWTLLQPSQSHGLELLQRAAGAARRATSEAIFVTGALATDLVELVPFLPARRPIVVRVRAAGGDPTGASLLPRCHVIDVSSPEELLRQWNLLVRR